VVYMCRLSGCVVSMLYAFLLFCVDLVYVLCVWV